MEHRDEQTIAMTDEQIVNLYWQRNEQAIKETDIKYRKYLLSIAYNILHDAHDSEECLSDTYMGAWNPIPPARPAFLQSFLSTIMRRKAIDRYKKEKRKKRIASELTVSLSELENVIFDDNEHSEANAKALSRIINDFVRSLPKRRMYVFMSRYYVARPIGEIAKLIGCSESTVHKEIAAIKRDLKEKLKKEGYSL